MEGGIVHELCHIDSDLKLGAYQRRLAWERYARSRWYRIREERAIETRVIELGYGRHLLELIRFTGRLGYTFDREHGLSYAEVLRALSTPTPVAGPSISATRQSFSIQKIPDRNAPPQRRFRRTPPCLL